MQVEPVGDTGPLDLWEGTRRAGARREDAANPSYGLTIGAEGSVLFGEPALHRIRRVSPQGVVTTVAGAMSNCGFGGDGLPATTTFAGPTRLRQPCDPELGPDGSLYFIDSLNRRVRRIPVDGILETAAGNGALCDPAVHGAICGDGGPAVAAQLRVDEFRGDISVGADGALYIAEPEMNRVRRVSADGVIRNFAGVRGWSRRGRGAEEAFRRADDEAEGVIVGLARRRFTTRSPHSRRHQRAWPRARSRRRCACRGAG